MDYQALLARIKEEEEKLRREADRKREIAIEIERLLKQAETTTLEATPRREPRAIANVRPLRLTDVYLPEGWLPAGVTGPSATTRQDHLSQIANHIERIHESGREVRPNSQPLNRIGTVQTEENERRIAIARGAIPRTTPPVNRIGTVQTEGNGRGTHTPGGTTRHSSQPRGNDATAQTEESASEEVIFHRRMGESWKEFRLRSGVHRPPKYIREQESKSRRETPAERGKREARQDKAKAQQDAIQKEIDKKRQMEVDIAWAARQKWLTQAKQERMRQEQEDRTRLRQEATDMATQIYDEVIYAVWKEHEKKLCELLNGIPLLTETASRRMRCEKCQQRGHNKGDCPTQTENTED
ncbi:uncharacterized protein LOC122501852 [Leptopilina heterotoma]|uniref:uncharacterized protein LOC122501852 n=1 Tax=Leptopilina heterotoma TaxID=63436 RepID=UPI001CA9BB8C|nr:uncharacterized protein LOC122501852 [Leptopilina heterotoma]